MGCEHLKGKHCEADPEHRRCMDVPKDICLENFKYKKVGQLILG